MIPKAKVIGRAAAVANLYVSDDAIGVGTARMMTQGKQRLADVEAVEITSDVAAKSRAGKVVLFGVLGLGAKRTQDRTTVMLRMRDGSEAGYQIMGQDAATVRIKLGSALRAAGIEVR